jgi:hypothetical protein
MKRALALCALGAGLLSACDVTTVAQVPSAITQNICQSDADCAGGACTDNQCRSRKGTFDTLLFAVTPPAEASPSAGLQFLQRKDDLSLTGGSLSLSLDPVVQVTGKATLYQYDCTPKFDDNGMQLATSPDNSIPVVISLTPSAAALGVYSPAAVAQTTLINTSYFSFSLNVPPGDYDVYVQPLHQDDATCVVPPQLQRALPVTADQFTLSVSLPQPSSFEFHVTWPAGDGGLDGWTVDMLDPVSGLVISNSANLAVSASDKTDYVATVYYLPVLGDTSTLKAQELVRLSPPASVVAPSVLLSRSALGLFDANRGTLSDFTALPTPVKVNAQVTKMVTPDPVAATVTLVATKIDGIDPGVLASFVRTVTVGASGQFEVDLLPGTYQVSAVPTIALDSSTSSSDDARLAEASVNWLVPDAPSDQYGKVIELNQALPINGQAFDTSFSTPVATALVQAVASTAAIKTSVLDQALGQGVAVPRAGTGSVAPGTGDFSLLADSGTFDVSVQPLPATGFPWLVVPSVGVGTAADNSAGVNLGKRGLPLPVVYRGTVTQAGSNPAPDAVPGALIRAFVYAQNGAYTSDWSNADSLVQVAETRADANATFTLFIPAELNGSVAAAP